MNKHTIHIKKIRKIYLFTKHSKNNFAQSYNFDTTLGKNAIIRIEFSLLFFIFYRANR